jgi:hypothetical protein
MRTATNTTSIAIQKTIGRAKTTNIAVVIGNSPIETYWLGQMHGALQPFTDRVAFTWFNELSFDDTLKRFAALPPRSAILFALLSVDAVGIPHEGGKALTSLHAVVSFASLQLSNNIGGKLSAPQRHVASNRS